MSAPTEPPEIDGRLESSLCAGDLGQTAASYRDVIGLKAILETPRDR